MQREVKTIVILIVDQEKILVDLLVQELGVKGITVYSTPSGQMGTRFLDELRPDVIIFDPHNQGWEILSYIQSTDWPIGIIALTRSPEVHRMLAAWGIEHILDKSEGLQELLDAIHACVGSERDISRDACTGEASTSGESVQVLVVDDDPDILEMLSVALNEWGYTVLSATNGDRALEFVHQNPGIAIALLDLRIPGRGGMELLKEIRRCAPYIGVIIFSAMRDREIARQAINLGAFDYLSKPFEIRHLEAMIAACLSHTEYQNRAWWKRLIG